MTIIGNLVYYLTGYLSIDLPMLGLKSNAMGVAMVTNVGGFGYTDVSAPFTPFANNSLIVTVNAPALRPIVEEGQVKVAEVSVLHVRIDHRFADGSQGKAIQDRLLQVFANPRAFSRLNKA